MRNRDEGFRALYSRSFRFRIRIAQARSTSGKTSIGHFARHQAVRSESGASIKAAVKMPRIGRALCSHPKIACELEMQDPDEGYLAPYSRLTHLRISRTPAAAARTRFGSNSSLDSPSTALGSLPQAS